ncbi:MAG: riboflavin biosynthesis protein RibF [Clostridia bacterium]|nr:riboflavin biosynthesis protein RibF [Clostridia bacterium]
MTRIDLKTMCEEVLSGPLALAIGNFDGVHIGHRALLARVREAAEALRGEIPNIRTGVWCFAQPPSAFLSDKPVPQLSTTEEKLACFADAGIDCCILADFPSLKDCPPERFVREVLLDACDCRHMVCGFNFTFGARGQGNADTLRRHFGDALTVVEPICLEDRVVSSTAVRCALTEGDAEGAAAMLGRRWSVCLPVLHGKALGRRLGFPTVNQRFPAGHILPAFGVYATLCEIDGVCHPAVTNVGIRPSVDDGNAVTCESHILDLDADLYGRDIRVHFCTYLRTEQKFESLAALEAAIQEDIAGTRRYFGATAQMKEGKA